MSNRTSIAVSRETLKELYSAKFDLRVNTIESVIKGLLEEHRNKQDSVESPQRGLA